jgi:hypothetical protein
MGVQMIIDLDSQHPADFDPVSYLSGHREGRANRPAMRSRTRRCGAATFIIVACIGLVVAAHVARDHRGDESTDALAMEETTGGMSGGQHATAELALSDEERGRLYEGMMRIPDVSVANVPAPEVADALPNGVPLQDLPFGIAQEIPLVRDHKFVKFDDRIVVVDPKSRVVVAMIPRYRLLP